MTQGLVYVGKIIDLQEIPGADFIVSATVVCGEGGKWRGIVRKKEHEIGGLCAVFLPDSQLNEVDHAHLDFMKNNSWRVKMQRFKGSPSEVLIIPYDCYGDSTKVGLDITEQMKVTKYHKPVPPHLCGHALGPFPDFIPKTDELNYQRHPELVENLSDKPYYITEKADGSSTTAYKYKGKFGLCSRNLELERNLHNGYWKVAEKYQVELNLPEGIAIQWETIGPGIQSNPMGFSEIDGRIFSAYNIQEHKYLEFNELKQLCDDLKFPMVPVLFYGSAFNPDKVETLGEGKYSNGKEREGVVVRSQENIGHAPISFKVINLNYEK